MQMKKLGSLNDSWSDSLQFAIQLYLESVINVFCLLFCFPFKHRDSSIKSNIKIYKTIKINMIRPYGQLKSPFADSLLHGHFFRWLGHRHGEMMTITGHDANICRAATCCNIYCCEVIVIFRIFPVFWCVIYTYIYILYICIYIYTIHIYIYIIHIYIYSSYILGISHPRDWPPEIAEPQHSQLSLAQERGQRLQLLDKRQRWRDWRPRRPLPKRDPIYFHCWEIIRYPLKIQLFIWLSRSEIDRKLMEFLMFFCLVEADSQFTQSESIRRVGFVPPQAAWNVWNVWNVLHFFQ